MQQEKDKMIKINKIHRICSESEIIYSISN